MRAARSSAGVDERSVETGGWWESTESFLGPFSTWQACSQATLIPPCPSQLKTVAGRQVHTKKSPSFPSTTPRSDQLLPANSPATHLPRRGTRGPAPPLARDPFLLRASLCLPPLHKTCNGRLSWHLQVCKHEQQCPQQCPMCSGKQVCITCQGEEEVEKGGRELAQFCAHSSQQQVPPVHTCPWTPATKKGVVQRGWRRTSCLHPRLTFRS